jgi:hypothetical protein
MSATNAAHLGAHSSSKSAGRTPSQGIGQAVRNGQEAGTVKGRGDTGRPKTNSCANQFSEKASPADFVPIGGGAQSDSYAMADASQEEFESALGAARSEGNLSRAKHPPGWLPC